MDAFSATVQGFFHEPPLGKVKVLLFFHMGISLVCSMLEPDVSAFIAVLGYLALLNNHIEPLNLYLVLLPVSVVVDIIRMSVYSGKFSKSTGGFLVFLVIFKILGKLLNIWFGYKLSKEWESGTGDAYNSDFQKPPISAEGASYQAEGAGIPKVVHPTGPEQYQPNVQSSQPPAYQQGYQVGLN